MKKLLAALLAATLLAALLTTASAAVSATPNQKLALRTGPNTRYVELYTLPQSTRITAFEYESGNGVTWVLVEYTYNGEVCRGYTGLKRMSVNGSIPWAAHLNQAARVDAGGTVLAAPSPRGAYRGRVSTDEWVTLLEYEGDYAFIEFYDAAYGASSRGYVEAWRLGGGYSDDYGYDDYDYGSDYGYDYDYEYDYRWQAHAGASATPNQKLALRTGPNTKYVELYMLPQSTRIVAYEYESGNGVTWVLIEYTHNGELCRGYTGLKRMSVNGSIPWADPLNLPIYANYGCAVVAAPAYNAAYRGQISGGERVTLLDYENGYAYIEFYDGNHGAPSRGYVPLDAVE